MQTDTDGMWYFIEFHAFSTSASFKLLIAHSSECSCCLEFTRADQGSLWLTVLIYEIQQERLHANEQQGSVIPMQSVAHREAGQGDDDDDESIPGE